MIFLLLHTCLSIHFHRKSRKINTEQGDLLEIIQTGEYIREFSLILFNDDEQEVFDKQDQDTIMCNDKKCPNITSSACYVVSHPNESYTIDISGRFSLYDAQCRSKYKLSYDVFIKHKWGYLDFSMYPMIYISWIETLFYLILLILWVINACKHKKILIFLHQTILFVLILQLCGSIVSGVLYTLTNISKDDLWTQFLISDIVTAIKTLLTLFLIQLLANGMSIIVRKIEFCNFLWMIITSFFLDVTQFLLTSYLLNDIDNIIVFIALGVFIISAIGYFALIVYLVHKSITSLRVHMELIRQKGIDPETTPSWKQLQMYSVVSRAGIILFVLFIMSTCFIFVRSIDTWVVSFVLKVVICILYGTICYQCRIRYAMAATYCEDEDQYVVNDDNNPELYKNNEGDGLKMWKYGMELPKMPKKGYKLNQIRSEESE